MYVFDPHNTSIDREYYYTYFTGDETEVEMLNNLFTITQQGGKDLNYLLYDLECVA